MDAIGVARLTEDRNEKEMVISVKKSQKRKKILGRRSVKISSIYSGGTGFGAKKNLK